MKAKIVAVLPICSALITALGAVANPPAQADDLATAVYSGVNQLRPLLRIFIRDEVSRLLSGWDEPHDIEINPPSEC